MSLLLHKETPGGSQFTPPSYLQIIIDSFPVLMGLSLQIIIMTINLHYSDSSLVTAGLGLSMILIHSLGGSFILGFNSGYSNFASRAFGANNHQLFNKYLVKGAFNLIVLVVLYTILGFASQWLSILLGQDPEVSKCARDFYVYQLPGFYCLYAADFLRTYLNSQNIYKPLTYVTVSTSILHIVFSSLISSRYGMTGIIISTNLTMFCEFGITFYVERKYSVWKLDVEEFKVEHWLDDYRAFSVECFYVAFPLCMDLFMFEILALYVGSFLVIEQTAAHIAFTNIAMLGASLLIGFSYTSMIKIGVYIGQNNLPGILSLVTRTLILNQVSIQTFYLLLWLFQDRVYSFYTSDPQVVKHLRTIMLPYFIMNFFDAVQFIATQTYKALKMGSWVCWVFALSYYGVGLGSMVIMGRIIESKLLAAWYGFTLGLVTAVLVYSYAWKKMDLTQVVHTLYEEVKVEDGYELGTELITKTPAH